MSTRTYKLTFSAPGSQVLPQGRYFMVQQATAAVDIEARRRNAQPTIFDNVGAGLKYRAADEESKFSQLVVASSVAQVVDIIVSDDAEIDVASAVSVVGAALTLEVPSASVTVTDSAALATGASLDIAANASRRRITICNASTSAGSVWVRDQSGVTSAGIEVQPGMSVEFKTIADLRIRNNSGSSASISTFEEA